MLGNIERGKEEEIGKRRSNKRKKGGRERKEKGRREKEIQYSKREGREEMERITTREAGKGMGDLGTLKGGKKRKWGGGGKGRKLVGNRRSNKRKTGGRERIEKGRS